MREGEDAGRAMDDEPPVEMMTEMDQEAMDDEFESNEMTGESDDEAARKCDIIL